MTKKVLVHKVTISQIRNGRTINKNTIKFARWSADSIFSRIGWTVKPGDTFIISEPL